MSGRLNESDRCALLDRIRLDNPEHYFVYSLMIDDLSNDKIDYFSDRHVRHMMKVIKLLREGNETAKDKRNSASNSKPFLDLTTMKPRSLRFIADELGVSYRMINELESNWRPYKTTAAGKGNTRSTVSTVKFWALMFAVYYQVSPRFLLGKTKTPYEWILLDNQGTPVLNRNGKYRYLIQPLGVVSPQEMMAHECINAMIMTQEGKDVLLCFADFYDMNKLYVEEAAQWLGMMPVLKRIRAPIDKDIEEAGGIFLYFDNSNRPVSWLSRSLENKLTDTIELFRRLGCRHSECLFWLWVISSMDREEWKWISASLKTAGFCFRQNDEGDKSYPHRSYLYKSVCRELQFFVDMNKF